MIKYAVYPDFYHREYKILYLRCDERERAAREHMKLGEKYLLKCTTCDIIITLFLGEGY